jgi:hypothetical protein
MGSQLALTSRRAYRGTMVGRIVLGLLCVGAGVLTVGCGPELAKRTWAHRRRPGPLTLVINTLGFQLAGAGIAAGGLILVIAAAA